SMASFFGSWTSAKGVSAIVLPAYFVTIGFGSKLSRWLTPPFMKSQITLFAFGANWGRPSGGVHAAGAAYPSRCSIAASARPVKPIPMSARNTRRLIPLHLIPDPFPFLDTDGHRFYRLTQREPGGRANRIRVSEPDAGPRSGNPNNTMHRSPTLRVHQASRPFFICVNL